MLHVLIAQTIAEERERTIRRRLAEHEMVLEARAANAAAEAASRQPEQAPEERRCVDCPPLAAPAR